MRVHPLAAQSKQTNDRAAMFARFTCCHHAGREYVHEFNGQANVVTKIICKYCADWNGGGQSELSWPLSIGRWALARDLCVEHSVVWLSGLGEEDARHVEPVSEQYDEQAVRTTVSPPVHGGRVVALVRGHLLHLGPVVLDLVGQAFLACCGRQNNHVSCARSNYDWASF